MIFCILFIGYKGHQNFNWVLVWEILVVFNYLIEGLGFRTETNLENQMSIWALVSII